YATPPRRLGSTRPQPSDSPLFCNGSSRQAPSHPRYIAQQSSEQPSPDVHPPPWLVLLIQGFGRAFLFQSLTHDGSLAALRRLPQILASVAGAKASRQPPCVSIVVGSHRSVTQKLLRFGHFGIPFL